MNALAGINVQNGKVFVTELYDMQAVETAHLREEPSIWCAGADAKRFEPVWVGNEAGNIVHVEYNTVTYILQYDNICMSLYYILYA